MKYRYPFKQIWLPALLLALCLSLTLISTAAWLLISAAAEQVGSSAATTESVIPALLVLAVWIGCGVLAKRLKLYSFLYFAMIFWGVELILYLLCLIPPLFDAAQAFLSLATMPMWSYFALIELFDPQGPAATAILTVMPCVGMLGVFGGLIWGKRNK